ncbi:MAG: long-chain-fatty-acid--CoA ligase [Longimicrobiales bacterium]
MRGLMQDQPLLISQFIEHGGTVFGHVEVVSQTVEGPKHRSTWADVRQRSKQLANALTALGLGLGDRIATIAWSNHRHLEAYYGIAGIGAICHTINPRLHVSDLVYILNHAEDRYVMVDLTFLPLVEAIASDLESVEGFIVMTDREHMPERELSNRLCYEDLIGARTADYEWPRFDENTAANLCYTSGTTGHPKGVLYSHRSTVLHAYAACMPGNISQGRDECMLAVVPLFHANGWGIPYSAAMTGTKLVLPGQKLDGESLTKLMRDEEVTCTCGVPTVWLGLLDYWKAHDTGVPTLKQVGIGGAAPARTMIEEFERDFGIQVLHGWGMTEMNPIGTIHTLTAHERDSLTPDDQYTALTIQGKPIFGVEIKVVGEDGEDLPNDGESCGELMVRGPWICERYFKDEASVIDDEGWFGTGDIAKIDGDVSMQITDRVKDVIKSGGEWISSIDLENAAMGHPGVAHAAVIGIPHEKWSERPLLVVVRAAGAEPTKEDILEFLADKVAKWWLPDDVVFEDDLPVGGTGKVLKTKLREKYAPAKAKSAAV